jgi:hypothetical protein
MTEQEWLASTDPFAMLEYLRDRSSDRKRLLFVVACWRDAWTLIPDRSSRQAVPLLERFAETRSINDEVIRQQCEIEKHLLERVWNHEQGEFQSQPPWDKTMAIITATLLVTATTTATSWDSGPVTERAVAHVDSLGLLSAWHLQTVRHSALLRHLFGNPFKPCSVPSRWPFPIASLAEVLYDGQDCMFALHDALLEAGYSELADHFRQEQWHPKGCWALDLILQKQ